MERTELVGAERRSLLAELLRQLQLDGERDQSLLGAVVDVALEPDPFLVAGRDHPSSRRRSSSSDATSARIVSRRIRFAVPTETIIITTCATR